MAVTQLLRSRGRADCLGPEVWTSPSSEISFEKKKKKTWMGTTESAERTVLFW